MKKYILRTAVISLFFISSIGIAMEQKTTKTRLSSKEQTELRQAVIDYKKDRSPAKQEKIINNYEKKYPNDPLVQAKLNEKARFDNPQTVKKEPAKGQTKVKFAYYPPIQISNKSNNSIVMKITPADKKVVYGGAAFHEIDHIELNPHETKKVVPSFRNEGYRIYVWEKREPRKGINRIEPIQENQIVELIYDGKQNLYEMRDGKTIYHLEKDKPAQDVRY